MDTSLQQPAGPDIFLMFLLTRPKAGVNQTGQPLKATACRCGDGRRIGEADHCVKCGRLAAEAIRRAWGGWPCR